MNDQISNFAKSDSNDRTLNFSPTLSPFERNNENWNQVQKLKSASRYSKTKRNTISNYQANMKVVQKPILETNGSRQNKPDNNKKQIDNKKQMYQNNLKIHTKYNKNLLKHSAFKRINASKRNHSNFINSMDTDRSSQFRKKSVKSSIENSPNFVHKNNSQGKIVQ